MNLKPNTKHLLKKILTLKTMKTSNKLLITLAVSLIVIPIVVIAITVKMNYIQAEKLTQNNKSLEAFAATPNFVLRKMNKSFDKINILASKKAILKVILVENPNTGLKISDNEENNTGAFVDKNGVLQISNKNLKDNQTVFLSLVIFAPKINQLSITDALQLEFSAKAKQLNLNLKNLQSMLFHPNTKIDQLNINGDDLKNFFQGDNYVDKLYLNLKNSQFKASGASYKVLDIVLTGNSDISIEGDEVNKEKCKIDSLCIKTTGKSNLKVENIKVKKSSGSLSDSTSVNMPASVLKTMFNR